MLKKKRLKNEEQYKTQSFQDESWTSRKYVGSGLDLVPFLLNHD